MLNIRLLQAVEIPHLKGFAPPDWNTDLSLIFSFHYGQPYFYPIAAELDGELVGCANGLWSGNAAWLGNIVVLPGFRGQGIGYALTKHLVDFHQSKGCISQILIATKMGEPVYRKLGFETISNYVFCKAEVPVNPNLASHIRPATAKDIPSILRVDQYLTGEDRRLFLERFMAGAWVHDSAPGIVDGFFLPDLAQGPVLAENDTAGLALLAFKLDRGSRSMVVPEANQVALSFLREHGFNETTRAPRMILGKGTHWQPEHIYSRGGGYCG